MDSEPEAEMAEGPPLPSLRNDVIDAQDALLAVSRLPPANVPNALAESVSLAAMAADRSFGAAVLLYAQLKEAGGDEQMLRAFYEAAVAHGGASSCERLSRVCFGQVEGLAFDEQHGEAVGHA